MGYNPPPNWPRPPAGWTPEPGWQPDPSWPPPPPGWQLFVPDAPPKRRRGPLYIALVALAALIGAANLGISLLKSSTDSAESAPVISPVATASPTPASSGAPAPSSTSARTAAPDEEAIRITVANMQAAQNLIDSKWWGEQFCAGDGENTTDDALRALRDKQGRVRLEVLSVQMLTDTSADVRLKVTIDSQPREESAHFARENGKWLRCESARR